MGRQKIAAKYVNVVDRVIDEQRTLVPAFTVIQKVGEDIDLVVSQNGHVVDLSGTWFGGAMDEFDDRTLGDLVGRGLQGE